MWLMGAGDLVAQLCGTRLRRFIALWVSECTLVALCVGRSIGTGRDGTDGQIRKREDTHAGRDAATDPGSIAISGAVATAGEKREEQPGERTDQ